jgi:hypothetical protein
VKREQNKGWNIDDSRERVLKMPTRMAYAFYRWISNLAL